MELLLDSFMKESSETVINSVHDQNLSQWLNLLGALPNLKKKSDQLVSKTLKVIGLKLTDFNGRDINSAVGQKQIKLLRVTCSNQRFISAVREKIIEWSFKKEKKGELEEAYLILFDLCSRTLKKVPEMAKDFLYNLVITLAEVVRCSAHLFGQDEEILTGFESLEKKIRQQIKEPNKIETEKKKVLGFFKEYEKTVQQTGNPPDDFRKLEVVPSLPEILGTGKQPFFRPNKVLGAYENQEHYLDVQFRLLREDFLFPLRNSVKEFMDSRAGNGVGRSKALPKESRTKIYHNVMFSKEERSVENGLDHIFTLPSSLCRTVNWDKSKRLLPGCLVMLTADNCKTGIFGLTLPPPYSFKKKGNQGDPRRRELANGTLRLLLQDENPRIGTGTKFIMFECEAYFEAYRYNLRILQKIKFLEKGGNPMGKFIVEASRNVDLPRYYDKGGKRCDRMIVLPFLDGNDVLVPVADLENWDTKRIQDGLGLNEFQYDAFKMAITSELAVIQGPPGTGKTHVGLQIVKTLLLNKYGKRISWDDGRDGRIAVKKPHLLNGTGVVDGGGFVPSAPFLILCYTNHALDQFLELLLEKIPKLGIVRVGGQCKSTILEKYTLAQKRKDYICKYGDGNSVMTALRLQERNACRKKHGIEAAILRIRKEIEELKNPNGIFLWRKMEVFREGRANLVPKKIMELLEDWGRRREREWRTFDPNTFSVEELISTQFFLNLEVVRMRLDLDVRVWEESWAVKKEVEGEEDYDMDELLADRILDDDFVGTTDNVGDELDFDFEGYRDSLYVSDCSVKCCKARAEQCKTRERGEFEAVRFENKGSYYAAVLALQKSGVLQLPYVNFNLDVRNVNEREIWALYFRVVRLFLYEAEQIEKQLLGKFEDAKDALNVAKMKLYEARKAWLEKMEHMNAEILRDCQIIGATTTGAAKQHSLLEKAGVRVVIVEEAAEILEAHIVTALTEKCDQLILIGDHLQLRPSTTVYELGRDYRLNVSLFERMVKNDVSYKTLKIQHRMRPEISNLIRGPVYEELNDHQSVRIFPSIKGVVKNMFFVNHKVYEDNDKDLLSKSNLFEAKYLVGLCHYLIKQGYEKEKITVLTMYAGQMFLLKKLFGRDFTCRGVRITCVDNFQGEENDIILLSLVRSNANYNLGFVGVENRVCVALSRAKKGLYVIGNMECLKKNKIWSKVNRKLMQGECIGPGVELICDLHNRRRVVRSGEEFDKYKDGGCDAVCGKKLDCGHICKKYCYQDCECAEMVLVQGECGHMVGVECKDSKNGKVQCLFEVDKALPCGHMGSGPCSGDPGEIKCTMRAHKYLPCRHQAWLRCCDPTTTFPCKVDIDFTFPLCGHVRKMKCWESESAKCGVKCNATLKCGHKCLKTCHANDDPTHLFYLCNSNEQCRKRCVNGHTCTKKHLCSQLCPPCEALRDVVLEPCGHKQRILCCDNPQNHKCTAMVTVDRNCGHRLTVECHASKKHTCTERSYKYLRCGHQALVACNQPVDFVNCIQGPCGLDFPSDPRIAAKRRRIDQEDDDVIILGVGKKEKIVLETLTID